MSNTYSSADYKLFIFDLDGTLVNTLSDLNSSVNYALEKFSLLPITENECKSFVGNGTRLLIERAMKGEKSELTEEVHSVFSEHYREHFLDSSKPYENIPEVIKALKDRGAKLCVFSNKPDAFTKSIIGTLFGEDTFDLVLGARDDFPKKPDPTVENMIVSEFGFEKDECIHVGDSDTDVITAHNAGVKCLGCIWGFRTKEDLLAADCDYIIDTAADILK